MMEKRDLEMIAETVEKIVDQKLQPVTEEIQQVKKELKTDIDQVKKELKTDIDQVKMTLENETNRGIQIVAEGHVDLRRKLNETLRMKEDDEMIRIRVNRLERELNELKREIR